MSISYLPYLLAGFLDSIDQDHLVLLDFLISDDTQFLNYLVQYLRFAAEAQEGAILEGIVPTLIRLRLTIEKLQV